MIASSESPASRILRTTSAWSGVSGSCWRYWARPRTTFIGVRISWLIWARNRLFAASAAAAACFAASSAASAALRSVMSSAMPTTRVIVPRSSRTGKPWSQIHASLPSGRVIRYSSRVTTPSTWACMLARIRGRSSGTMASRNENGRA